MASGNKGEQCGQVLDTERKARARHGLVDHVSSFSHSPSWVRADAPPQATDGFHDWCLKCEPQVHMDRTHPRWWRSRRSSCVLSDWKGRVIQEWLLTTFPALFSLLPDLPSQSSSTRDSM